MFDMSGAVIGVNTAIFSQSGGNIGIGFAVPSSLARPVIEELRKNGEVRRGWLGVQIQAVTEDIAGALGLDGTNGALVSSVMPGSPAEEAGLEVGDVIVEFGGDTIEDPRELQRVVADAALGGRVEATVRRGGEN